MTAPEPLAELRALAVRRSHHVSEDCWYSCPASGECCHDELGADECNCGADEWNVKVDAALACLSRLGEAQVETRRQAPGCAMTDYLVIPIKETDRAD